MTGFTGVAAYLTIWWLVLFMVLPYRAHKETDVQLGNATSAPAKPLLKLKFLITSVLAAIIWLVIFLVLKMDMEYFDFYSVAENMSQEDRSE